MKRQQRGKILALQLFLILGMLISLFLLYEHYSPTASKYCTFGSNFDCGIVNKGVYANLDGISYFLTFDAGLNLPLIDISDKHWLLDLVTANSFLGFLTLVLLFFLVRTYSKGKSFFWIQKEKVLSWIRGILIFSIVYGFYLFFIMHSVLKTYCIFCMGLDIVMIVSAIISWRLK